MQRFIGVTCAIVSALTFALFFYLLDKVGEMPAFVAVGVMCVEFIAACILLIIGYKKSKTPSQERITKPLNKVIAITVCIAQVLMTSVPLFSVAVNNLMEGTKIEQRLTGYTFIYENKENYKNYILTFSGNNKCTLTTEDTYRYTPAVSDTKKLDYKVKYSAAGDYTLLIDGERYTLDRYFASIVCSADDKNYTNKDYISAEEISVLNYNDIIKEYNDAIFGNSDVYMKYTADTELAFSREALMFLMDKNQFSTKDLSSGKWKLYSSDVWYTDDYGRAILRLVFIKSNYETPCYDVLLALRKDGERKYAAYIKDSDKIDLATFKEKYHFGEPPNLNDENAHLFLRTPDHEAPSAESGKKTLNTVETSAKAFTLTSYIASDTNSTLAVKLKVRYDYKNDMDKIIPTITNIFTDGKLSEKDIEQVFSEESGAITDKPIFLHDGYILYAQNNGSIYTYTITNGRALGCAEGNIPITITD